MVESLRTNNISYQKGYEYDGLFVVGKSNAEDLSIPHLPRLIRSGIEPSHAEDVSVVDNKNQLLSKEIYSNDLFSNFSNGDIVWLDSKANKIRTLLSSNSTANTLLLTERCENRCHFCSQPPNDLDDTQLYTNAALALLNYNSQEVVGLSGGEPTFNSSSFLHLLKILNAFENKTSLHILTNGRKFSEKKYTKKVSDAINGRDILWGVPIYGVSSSMHDESVQSEGAFIETITGLNNLLEQGQAIELRIIPIQHNIKSLHHIVNFILDTYPFIKLISIMNIEPKGWARKNFSTLSVPVKEQMPYLRKSIDLANRYDVELCLYNYPLCLLEPDMQKNTKKSISDWKNYYLEECDNCLLKNECGGFFYFINWKIY